jgi:putative ABC transport system permease protein
MSLWSRIANVFRGDRLSREIDEELRYHIEEAIEQGRDPSEARRAFGSALRLRESSRDIRIAAWLDSLRADSVFGWRQLMKRKVTSAAAILSLALAIGACTSAFRLIDALLLRPLPIAAPERLYALFRLGNGLYDGKPRIMESYEYPLFRQMRAAVSDQAELLAASSARIDLTFGSDDEMEKAQLQYVSAAMFGSFGLKPALGRLLTWSDDLKPRAHPYAVLSWGYWTSRFGRDPGVVGRGFRMGNDLFEVVGVAPELFTGTEPGAATDIFIPATMNPYVDDAHSSWLRILVSLKPGAGPDAVRDRLSVIFQAWQEKTAADFTARPRQFIERYLGQKVLLEPAPAGVSQMQGDYRRSLLALGVLVGLVLLIACANVANLMTAQAAARAREMALRVSIGAGRRRLIQLVLVESAWLAFLSTVLGGLFAWWSAPLVVTMISPPDNPARLALPWDWRVLGFALALTLAVTFLFGLAPAVRASAVQPANALKGGEDPHSRRRLMHSVIAAQVAFCFLVLFVAGLFVATFARLSHQPTGFSSERLLTLATLTQHAQAPARWDQAAEHLRAVRGVETVAQASWPLLSGTGRNGFVSVNGAPPGEAMNYFLSVSPGWVDIMKIYFKDGRDFRPGDAYCITGIKPSVAIVNETFIRQYFSGQNALGRSFEKVEANGSRIRFEIVGVIADARYRDMREPIAPTIYVPLRTVDAKGAFEMRERGTFLVRTSLDNPLALAPALRRAVRSAGFGFRVTNLRTQKELNEQHTVRERLLAMLALFFAMVALLLAGVGLYGVLDYSVLQRRREIGIRIAIGAQPARIARLVTMNVFSMVLAGALAGLAAGMASVRSIESLFYQVKPTDAGMLALPSLAILTAALAAALPAVIRAVRIDPARTLRAE